MKAFDGLVRIMARLRGKNGCPWDKAQDMNNLKRYVIEEAYEVVDAIDTGKPEVIKEELGDLALQIVFMAGIANERGWFDIEDVINGISKKLIHRHPHVFGNTKVDSKDDVVRNWGRQKHNEKGSGIFDIPLQMPALLASYRLLEKARRLGLNPVKPDSYVTGKIKGGSKQKTEKQIAEMLLSIVAASQERDINPEDLLRTANKAIISRLKTATNKNKF